MERLSGMTLQHLWSDRDRARFSNRSRRHISVWQTATGRPTRMTAEVVTGSVAVPPSWSASGRGGALLRHDVGHAGLVGLNQCPLLLFRHLVEVEGADDLRPNLSELFGREVELR